MSLIKKIQDGGIFFLSTFLVIASNYAFHLISARYLDQSHYGILSGLFAFFGIVAFASVSLQTKATETTARLTSRGQWDACKTLQYQWLKRSFLWSALLVALAFGGTVFIARFFHAQNLTIMLFLPVYLITIPHSMIRGFMQGYQAFRPLSGGFLLESLLKCLLAFGALHAGFGLNGVILALTASQIPSLLWGLWVVFGQKHGETNKLENLETLERNEVDTPQKESSFWIMLLYFILFSSWFNADMILMQNLQPELAGSYSIASKLGQIILFAGANVGNFLFPTLVQRSEKGQSLTQINLLAFALILGGSLFGIYLLDLGKTFFVSGLFGSQYQAAENWLLYMGGYGLVIGLIHYLVQWEFALAKRKFIAILIAGSFGMFSHLALVLPQLKNPQDLTQAFEVLIGWGIAMIVVLSLHIWKDNKKKFAGSQKSF